MASGLLFYYFGNDEAYFRTLQGEFKRHTRLVVDFQKIYCSDEVKIQSLFLKVHEHKPVVVFIDFSKHTQDNLHLARLLARMPKDNGMITVGLVDYLSSSEAIFETIATGVNLTHIKSAETFDVVFDVAKLIAPQEMTEHGFATATLKETFDAGIVSKVGYVHASGMHIETDFMLSKGDRVKINHYWTKGRIVPSKEMIVKEVSRSNIFYQFQYACDLEFMFMDEFIAPDGMEDDRIKERKQEREDNIIHHKKLLKKWIDDNLDRSQEKRSKIFVVDQAYHFYQDQPRTDKHPFIVRCVPFIKDFGEELERLRPHVVAFCLEKDDAPDAKNTNEQLVKLVDVLKAKFSELNPFIIVFNSEASSNDLQLGLAYSNVMAMSQELAPDLLLKMVELFEKKRPAPQGMNQKGLEKIFLKKTNNASICEVVVPINVMKLSETDMIFQSSVTLPTGINLHVAAPVDMYINVQAGKVQGKSPEYHGLIHCLGEEDKKELRKYVNSVFFREHDAKLQEDVEKFKELNEKKQQEKADLEKKKQEEKEKEANVGADKDARPVEPAAALGEKETVSDP